MTPKRFARICRVLNRRQPDLTVVTDEVHKGRNLSAILRTCDAVGIDALHCVIPGSGFRHYRGTALGTQKWVRTHKHSSIVEPLELLRSAGFQILAADMSERAVDYRNIDYTLPTALVLGAEREGVSETAARHATHHVTVPMLGMVESLNVSVACAIILMEAQRQRQAAGLYEQRRLTQAQFDERFFRWAHPTLARYCDQRGLDYPPVGEDGELVDGPGWYQKVRLQAGVAEAASRR